MPNAIYLQHCKQLILMLKSTQRNRNKNQLKQWLCWNASELICYCLRWNKKFMCITYLQKIRACSLILKRNILSVSVSSPEKRQKRSGTFLQTIKDVLVSKLLLLSSANHHFPVIIQHKWSQSFSRILHKS